MKKTLFCVGRKAANSVSSVALLPISISLSCGDFGLFEGCSAGLRSVLGSVQAGGQKKSGKTPLWLNQ